MQQEEKDLKTLLSPGFRQAIKTGNKDGAELTNLLVGDALEAKATDIHLDPQRDHYRVRFRVDGRLYPVNEMSHQRGKALARSIEVGAGIDPAAQADRHEGSARFGPKDTPVRVASVTTVQGPKLSLRLLQSARVRHDIRDLGLEKEDQDRLLEWADKAEGMVLCVGPTGCGKSTTCYSLLNAMKDRRNILTLEDPVEFTLDGLNQISLDPDSPGQPSTFAQGVHDILRHDPDAVFLGEIRDRDTAQAAVNASFSGHVLLSTMHSRDPAGVITLLRSMGSADHEIAASVSLIMGQRLLRCLCPDCREARPPKAFEREIAGEHGVDLAKAWEASGCQDCGETGHKGLTAVFELWHLQDEDYEAILAHEDEKSLRHRLRQRGVPSLAEAALERAARGQVSLTEALAVR